MLDTSKDQVGIVHVTGRGRTEGQDAASGKSVIGKASFDEVGMNLLKVFHGGAVLVYHGEVRLV